MKRAAQILTLMALATACGWMFGQTTTTTTTASTTYTPPAGVSAYLNGAQIDLTAHQLVVTSVTSCTASLSLITSFGVQPTNYIPPTGAVNVCSTTNTVTEDGTAIDLTKNYLEIYQSTPNEANTTTQVSTY